MSTTRLFVLKDKLYKYDTKNSPCFVDEEEYVRSAFSGMKKFKIGDVLFYSLQGVGEMARDYKEFITVESSLLYGFLAVTCVIEDTFKVAHKIIAINGHGAKGKIQLQSYLVVKVDEESKPILVELTFNKSGQTSITKNVKSLMNILPMAEVRSRKHENFETFRSTAMTVIGLGATALAKGAAQVAFKKIMKLYFKKLPTMVLGKMTTVIKSSVAKMLAKVTLNLTVSLGKYYAIQQSTRNTNKATGGKIPIDRNKVASEVRKIVIESINDTMAGEYANVLLSPVGDVGVTPAKKQLKALIAKHLNGRFMENIFTIISNAAVKALVAALDKSDGKNGADLQTTLKNELTKHVKNNKALSNKIMEELKTGLKEIYSVKVKMEFGL